MTLDPASAQLVVLPFPLHDPADRRTDQEDERYDGVSDQLTVHISRGNTSTSTQMLLCTFLHHDRATRAKEDTFCRTGLPLWRNKMFPIEPR